ncbi:hypothetical protein TNCV_4711911 [Trichonephila clavipes]|nr:hypothetical protein TNCV_4711911 [Trichonephila clavipes]
MNSSLVPRKTRCVEGIMLTARYFCGGSTSSVGVGVEIWKGDASSQVPSSSLDHDSKSRATRGLLVTDLVIFKLGQLTKTTPKLAPPSPSFHTTPTGGPLSIGRFNVHLLPTRRVFSGTSRGDRDTSNEVKECHRHNGLVIRLVCQMTLCQGLT